jgi:uncharacterized protein (DUF697 family)
MSVEEKEIEIVETQDNDASNSDSVKKDCDKLITHHVIASMGAGLIPVPLVDLVALTGIQLNMLRKLAEKHDITFSKDAGKNLLGALLGSSLSLPASRLVASVVKFIPVIGQATGTISLPVTAGASTYAVGRVFDTHFSTGGTFLNFDAEKMKEYYHEMFEKGKAIAADLKEKHTKK